MLILILQHQVCYKQFVGCHKNQYLVFGKVSIDEFILTRVCGTKFLGVQIDESLNWEEHIKLVTSKLIKVSGIIFRTKRVLNYDSLYTLYCLLFLPYINYCSEIWGNIYKTKFNSIILIQKKVIWAICGINDMRTNTSPLFYKCGILKFVDLIAYKTLIVMFKVKNNLLPIGIQSLFTINSNSYNTRQSGKFNKKYVRTTIKSMTVSVAGVKLWNSLKTNITTIKKICEFKKMCKYSIS